MARKKSATNRTISSHGYVLIWKPEHHLADIRGYVYEHRLIMEDKLGRKLSPSEQIHHRDGIKINNSPDNLGLMSTITAHRFKHRKQNSNIRKPGEINKTIVCACGCGVIFSRYDHSGRPRRYISGHNPQSSPLVDKILILLEEGPKTITQLSMSIPENNAIKTTCSKLVKTKVISRIKRGVYGRYKNNVG